MAVLKFLVFNCRSGCLPSLFLSFPCFDTLYVEEISLLSSCRLNEEMIETLFVVNFSKDRTKHPTMPVLNQENRVLDPKKSQNIAILLRALNVTIDEVCEALLEGKRAGYFMEFSLKSPIHHE